MFRDRTSRLLLSVIALLLGAHLLVDINNASGPRTAMAAGIPDQGAQLQSLIEQMQDLNKKVDKLQGYLESGKMTVVVESKDKDK